MVTLRTFLGQNELHFIENVLKLPKPTLPLIPNNEILAYDFYYFHHPFNHGIWIGKVTLIEEVKHFFNKMSRRPTILDVFDEFLFIIEVKN